MRNLLLPLLNGPTHSTYAHLFCLYDSNPNLRIAGRANGAQIHHHTNTANSCIKAPASPPTLRACFPVLFHSTYPRVYGPPTSASAPVSIVRSVSLSYILHVRSTTGRPRLRKDALRSLMHRIVTRTILLIYCIWMSNLLIMLIGTSVHSLRSVPRTWVVLVSDRLVGPLRS